MANILLNLLAARSGGQITRASAFLDRIKKISPSNDFIILKDSEVLNDLSYSEKFHVHNFRFENKKFKVVKRFIWENIELPKLIKKYKIDLYLTFSHYVPRSLNKTPSVVGITNLAPFSIEAIKSERFLVRLKLKLLKKTILSSANRANSIIAISKKCRKILIDHGIDDKKIIVNPNGVDDFWTEEDKSNYNHERFDISEPFILYVSHFHFYKNHENLIIAFSKLPKKIQDNHKLVFIGKAQDRYCFNYLKNLIKNLELNDKIVIIDGLDQKSLRKFYQKSKLFAFPSLIENCPNILLEAMRSGCAIISSKLDPMPEFCEENVVYFDPLDPLNIRDRIFHTLSDADLRVSLSKSSQKQSLMYSWDNFTHKVSKEIDKILR